MFVAPFTVHFGEKNEAGFLGQPSASYPTLMEAEENARAGTPGEHWEVRDANDELVSQGWINPWEEKKPPVKKKTSKPTTTKKTGKGFVKPTKSKVAKKGFKKPK